MKISTTAHYGLIAAGCIAEQADEGWIMAETISDKYDGFHKFLKKYKIEITDNTCLACRLLFEYYGWLDKIDADYEMPTYDHVDGKVVKQDGKAMAYTLTPQFSFYKEFEKSVGKKNIDKVRTKGLVSVQDWHGMGETA